MALSNTEYGKAYEYACLTAIMNQLVQKGTGLVSVTESAAYLTAKNAFEKSVKEGYSDALVQAANAAARVILRL